MQFLNCEIADLPALLHFYEWGRQLQQEKSDQQWKGFDPDLVRKEITECRQWKMVEDGNIVCVFLTAYEDPFIWGEKNADPSVYLHRIVTHPGHRGKGFVKFIVDWAKTHAKQKGLQYVRMDTWGDNPRLIEYYKQCGFELLGIVTPESTAQLPAHYDCISLSLFELKIG